MNETLERIIVRGYGMYTTAGSKSIENKMRTCIKRLEKEDATLGDKIEALRKVVVGWRKMHSSKSYSESGDTAVREEVWITLVKIAEHFRIPECVTDWVWDNSY